MEEWNMKEPAVICSVSPFRTPIFQPSNIPLFYDPDNPPFQYSIIPVSQYSVPLPYWTKVQYTNMRILCMVGENLFSKGGESYMSKVRTVSRLALFLLVMAFASYAGAAQKATPSGKVTLETTSIAAGVGVSWGDGKLNLKGKTYSFSIDGLSLVDWGISKASATGDVYNLKDAAQLGGTYVAAEAGLTLAGGVGGMVLRNENGVILHLRSVSQGARLQLGTSGLIIKMK
jgi:hypothetical protein